MSKPLGIVIMIGLALCCAVGAAAPAVAATGSIAGTVTGAGSDRPIAGIRVCANGHPFGPIGGCELTDADGKYEIGALEPGLYRIAFEEEGRQNYLAQWYPDKP